MDNSKTILKVIDSCWKTKYPKMRSNFKLLNHYYYYTTYRLGVIANSTNITVISQYSYLMIFGTRKISSWDAICGVQIKFALQ